MNKKAFFSILLPGILFFQILYAPFAAAQVRIMPLGDSITQGSSSGEDVPSFQVGYRLALWDQLVSAGYDVDFVGSRNAGSSISDFDPNHEGHPGYTAAMVASEVYNWLTLSDPDIVLLHIGTNGLTIDPSDVEAILDEIDSYEVAFGIDVWVILARIINRENYLCPNPSTTTTFNNNVEAMALSRVNNPANPAYPDKIIIVGMECGVGMDYRLQPTGDMYDAIHPYHFGDGYGKMADLWFDALTQILPNDPPPSNGGGGGSGGGGGGGCLIRSAGDFSSLAPRVLGRQFRDVASPKTAINDPF